MKRLFILAALLAGCDDDTLPAKVANAQLHGFVEAQVFCGPTCEFVKVSNPSVTTSGMNYRANRLLDGSCLVTATTTPGLVFLSRSDSEAETCRGEYASSWMTAEAGKIELQLGTNPVDHYQADIETCCTGFNLESFGVE